MRALIFDFDGLILDTETPELIVWSETFAEYGLEIPSGYWDDAIGRGAEQEIERPSELLARLSKTPVNPEEIRRKCRERVRALINLEQVRPGILKLLDEAAEHRLRVGVASSSRHDWVDGYLSKHGLLDRFSVIACADDVQRAKPFPDLYLLACSRLGVVPSTAVALEDSANGIAAAKAAGLFAVAVPNRATQGLDFTQADMRIDDLASVTLNDLKQASSTC